MEGEMDRWKNLWMDGLGWKGARTGVQMGVLMGGLYDKVADFL